MVDELELLIENPIEIKSKKNRRQAESDHRHLGAADGKMVRDKKVGKMVDRQNQP